VFNPEINLPQSNWLKPSTVIPLPLIAMKERKPIKREENKTEKTGKQELEEELNAAINKGK
jgi:hypothetical protein